MKQTITIRCLAAILGAMSLHAAATLVAAKDSIAVQLRYQVETSDNSLRFHPLLRQEDWQPDQTALIVCDVWDSHSCLNAARRVHQMAPYLDIVLQEARSRGITIIHAPSGCMRTYEEHPARRRAVSTPVADRQPDGIREWCKLMSDKERAAYPIDQSDSNDDDPFERAEWVAQLKSMGRNPRGPWTQQSPLITIDAERDLISDRGDEIWNILQSRGIENVILTGVHTNMCVLGRPFGLRQMARVGKNVVLMRDMTDTMYNPRRWPYVSHFTGTDLIVDHIERFVCPTIRSDQLTGGRPFRFPEDQRPHVVFVMAEDEYKTAETLPRFAAKHLGRDFRVTLVFASDRRRNEIPGLHEVENADLLVISVRRRVLRAEDMRRIRDHVASGKPVIGIRTASHAFSLGGAEPPAGFVDWPEFDAEVLGGNYQGHHGNALKSTIHVVTERNGHPILTGIGDASFQQGWSLYKTSPLAAGTTTLLTGHAEGQPVEPVAWTFTRRGGGRTFYTSLGHPDDFENPAFVRLLINSIHWATRTPTGRSEPTPHEGGRPIP